MSSRKPIFPLILGALTLLTLAPLVIWDVFPQAFPAHAHDVVSAVPLTVVALAFVVYQIARGASAKELAKSLLSAGAFVFWALNQLWPDSPYATLCNDIAVAAFVVDVVLVILDWPPAGAAPRVAP